MKETKVKCPQCGAEFDVLAEHQHMATGMVIGKDSEMGTILLPLLKKGEYKDAGRDIYIESETFNKVMNNVNKEELPMELQQSIKLMQNMSVNDKLAAIFKALDISKDDVIVYASTLAGTAPSTLNPQPSTVRDEIEETIRSQGAVRDIRLFRRRIVAMVLNAEFGTHRVERDDDGNYVGGHYEVLGFHKWLKAKGYMYQWEMLVGKSSHEKYCELVDQERLYRHKDMECFGERNMYFNPLLVSAMAWDCINRVMPEFIKTLVEKHSRRHGLYYKLGHKRYIKTARLEAELYQPMRNAALAIEQSTTPAELLTATKAFVALIPKMKWDFESTIGQFRGFMEAYKASGAFNVVKSLCYQGFYVTDDNGNRLTEIAAHEFIKGAYLTREPDGYKMLGLMREFLKQNGFDYKKQCEEWHKMY